MLMLNFKNIKKIWLLFINKVSFCREQLHWFLLLKIDWVSLSQASERIAEIAMFLISFACLVVQ